MDEQPITEAPRKKRKYRRRRIQPQAAELAAKIVKEMQERERLAIKEMDEMGFRDNKPPSSKVQVVGRDGIVLSRKRTGNIDPYAIPPHIRPEGWDYQWNLYTVMNEPAVDAQILMAENGWRPVPAERPGARVTLPG